MIQKIPGNFRQSGNANPFPGSNIAFEFVDFTTFQSDRQSGAKLVDGTVLSPKQGQRWSVLSLSITAYLALASNGPVFGKLGKIIGGILPPETDSPTVGGTDTFYIGTNGEIPADSTLLLPLYDPDNDPLPPFNPESAVFNFLPISASLQLPQPIELLPGETVLVGLYMLPTLIAFSGSGDSFIYLIYNASYVITYDDGL